MNQQLTPSGLLLIDKPTGMSSFDIIRVLRRQTGIRKIGHCGTLDPMASGLMLMVVGGATKRATELTKLDKTYEAVIALGATSSTGDAEGELTTVSGHQPTHAEVEAAVAAHTGRITQTPPAYSAIKINGVAAYKRIRRGEEVMMPAREVTVYSSRLTAYRYPEIHLTSEVSSGTYIRTLAADIGATLGTGAYLSGLRRTVVGEYSLDQASQLESITADNITLNFQL